MPDARRYYLIPWQDILRVNEEVSRLPRLPTICLAPHDCPIHREDHMATMRSDLDSMLRKLSPLRAAPPEPDPRVVAHRWEFHKPFALMAARETLDPAGAFVVFKQRHVERLTALYRAGIQPVVIYRNRYDDPLPKPERFERVLAEAIERRRSRMGRVKGQGKKYTRTTSRKSKGTT